MTGQDSPLLIYTVLGADCTVSVQPAGEESPVRCRTLIMMIMKHRMNLPRDLHRIFK